MRIYRRSRDDHQARWHRVFPLCRPRCLETARVAVARGTSSHKKQHILKGATEIK